MSEHIVLKARGMMIRFDPERKDKKWTAVSNDLRQGDFETGDEALDAALGAMEHHHTQFRWVLERFYDGPALAMLSYTDGVNCVGHVNLDKSGLWQVHVRPIEEGGKWWVEEASFSKAHEAMFFVEVNARATIEHLMMVELEFRVGERPDQSLPVFWAEGRAYMPHHGVIIRNREWVGEKTLVNRNKEEVEISVKSGLEAGVLVAVNNIELSFFDPISYVKLYPQEGVKLKISRHKLENAFHPVYEGLYEMLKDEYKEEVQIPEWHSPDDSSSWMQMARLAIKKDKESKQ